MDMEEDDEGLNKSEVLDAISNLYSLLHIPPPIRLDGRARRVLKCLLDAAHHNLLFHSSTEFFNASPPLQTIHRLHPDPSATANSTVRQLVSNLSSLTVSSSHSDNPQPPVKRCRQCKSKQPILNSAKPVPSSSTATPATVSQPRMQETNRFTWSQPWFIGSNVCNSTGHLDDGFGGPGRLQQSNCEACTVSTASIRRLCRDADLAMAGVSDDTGHDTESTCCRQTFRKWMLKEPKLPARGLESLQGVQEEDIVYQRDTMGNRNVSQRPLVKQNTEYPASEQQDYVHDFRVTQEMDGIPMFPTMKAATETKEKQMPSPTGHNLAKAQSHKKHLKASTAIRPSMLDYEITSPRNAQYNLQSRSRTSNTKSQQWKKDSEEEWSSSVGSRASTPSSSFASYSWTSRQHRSTGSSSSNSENFSRSDYNLRESASKSSSTVEESKTGSSYVSSSYPNTDGRDGDSGSRSTRYRRSGRERAVGRFKRVKDKLRLIFHHHHHHYHHHHDHRKQSKNGSKATTRKHLREKFQHEGKPERYAEKAVVKKHGNVVVEKNQGQHFHALVQGLMQHAKNSKKSKTSKTSEIGGRRIFLQQRRVKLPNRRQFRLGLRGKKPQLKAA